MTIGILALQGDYQAHRAVLETLPLANRVLDVHTADELQQCDGLVLPGGESTTMSRLCDRYGLWQPLQERLRSGMGAFGTCAGLILLAQNIEGATRNFEQKTLGALDIDVSRNAYGAQVDSFETELEVGDWRLEAGSAENFNAEVLPETFPASSLQSPASSLLAVFIRAPRIVRCGEKVRVLARHNGEAVAVRQGKVFGAAFHPEIAGETRLHALWLRSLAEKHQTL